MNTITHRSFSLLLALFFSLSFCVILLAASFFFLLRVVSHASTLSEPKLSSAHQREHPQERRSTWLVLRPCVFLHVVCLFMTRLIPGDLLFFFKEPSFFFGLFSQWFRIRRLSFGRGTPLFLNNTPQYGSLRPLPKTGLKKSKTAGLVYRMKSPIHGRGHDDENHVKTK